MSRTRIVRVVEPFAIVASDGTTRHETGVGGSENVFGVTAGDRRAVSETRGQQIKRGGHGWKR